MADDSNFEQGQEAVVEQVEEAAREKNMIGRRDFLKGLQKWSAIVIGAADLGSIAAPEAAAWVNGRGAWVNGHGGGGSAAWVNRSGGWVNAAGWVNRSGGGSAAWVNRSGGGGWVNTRGGWINR